jgi:2-phospho-L-lactate/phosphoenolpyruvate guanylyltransferase
MSLCAIIPVKPLRRGKSRLSCILSSTEREILNRNLLQSLLISLQPIELIDHKIVISYDPAALAFARKFGATTVLENRNTNINRALRRATMAARAYGATKILILPADLPLISQADVEELLSFERTPSQIIIVPDRKMNGTNALFINPIGAIKYNFGDWSFRKHTEQAERKKIDVKILNNKNISFDLDIPEDWELLEKYNCQKKNEIQKLFKEAVT